MSLRLPEREDTGLQTSLPASDIQHFDAIARFAYERAGLVLPREKAPMVLARIGKRMRALRIPRLEDYRNLIERKESDDERRELIFALTTNVTSFFREAHHFETLRETVIPALRKKIARRERVRIWSAGCSTGQEPYSIAMTLLSMIPNIDRCDIKILATDVDAHVLSRAKTASYGSSELEMLPKNMRQRFSTLSTKSQPDQETAIHTLTSDVRRLVTFRELNLLDPWPMRGRFDIVFCRNVIIYFDRLIQERLWSRLYKAIVEGGYLFLGHSERVDTSAFPQFNAVGTTTYCRSGCKSVEHGRY